MRSWILTLTALVFPLAGVAEGQAASCLCGLQVGAEWVYLRPYNADMIFFTLAQDEGQGNGLPTATADRRRLCARPQYDSGVRVWLGYRDRCSCYGIRADYLYFDSSYSSRLAGETNQGVNQFRVSGRPRVEYQRAAVEVTGRLTSCSCPFELTGLLGVGWAEVTRRRRVEQSSENPSIDREISIRDRAYFSGVGPRVGVDLRWEVPCWSCLALHGQVAGSLLVAKSNADRLFDSLTSDPETGPFSRVIEEQKLDSCYRIAPAFEARVGLQGSWVCGCTEITGEVGYRVDTYINALGGDIIGFGVSTPGSPPTDDVVNAVVSDAGTFNPRNDISFGGLYLGLQVTF